MYFAGNSLVKNYRFLNMKCTKELAVFPYKINMSNNMLVFMRSLLRFTIINSQLINDLFANARG
jgi:hypothetical protein